MPLAVLLLTPMVILQGLVFGDFSELESEERAKIDSALRDGSNAVEVRKDNQN